ncbi:MAG: hypothetical protein ACYDAB_03520 [bacterium]
MKYVQKFGPELERAVSKTLDWPGGRVVYAVNEEEAAYDIQVDCCSPHVDRPEAVVSVTYCKPDTPGHSNENKLQLKIGELMLIKSAFPSCRSVLVIGGNEHTWLPYVLQAFNFFFDRTILAWSKDFEKQILAVKTSPERIALKHRRTWAQLQEEWAQTKLWTGPPIRSNLRKSMWEAVSETGCEGELPEHISNEIFRHCMTAAYERHKQTRGRIGKEWTNYLNENWDALWQSRSFFNPAEAAVELTLQRARFCFRGALAQDEQVPSLIHTLGGAAVDNTKVSEDFVLYSRAYDRPVFIQSKSMGGGLEGHGKNIQNRTKEQLARGLFYRGSIEGGDIVLRPKDFIWISILDGDWGVTKKTPLKYIHMLQWAGYDFLIAADALVTDDLAIRSNNELMQVLRKLDCEKSEETFAAKWTAWRRRRSERLR